MVHFLPLGLFTDNAIRQTMVETMADEIAISGLTLAFDFRQKKSSTPNN